MTGENAGRPLNPEMCNVEGVDTVRARWKAKANVPLGARHIAPSGISDTGMRGHFMHGTRESPRLTVADGATVRSENLARAGVQRR